MTTTVNPADARNRDFELIFVGDRCIVVTHFYSIGMAAGRQPGDGPECFAYGYWGYDGAFHQGIAKWSGESF